MNELILSILDLLDGDRSKVELLTLAKTLQRHKLKAIKDVLAMSEDAQDEFALTFGDKLFDLLRKQGDE